MQKLHETKTTVEISITGKTLALVSAAGGVATGSATRDPSTVTPEPSPETPLWTQNWHKNIIRSLKYNHIHVQYYTYN